MAGVSTFARSGQISRQAQYFREIRCRICGGDGGGGGGAAAAGGGGGAAAAAAAGGGGGGGGGGAWGVAGAG